MKNYNITPKAKWGSEVELGEVVVADFRSKGFTIYPELNNIDIIATKIIDLKLKIIGIECKTHFNLKVLAQAEEKRKYVDEIYIAVTSGNRDLLRYGRLVALKFGYGVILVSKTGGVRWGGEMLPIQYDIKFVETPVYIPRKLFDVDKLLDFRAENYASPGRSGGKQWSRFRMTVADLVDYIGLNPGCDTSIALGKIKHHYKNVISGRGCINNLIKSGVIKELRLENGKLFISD